MKKIEIIIGSDQDTEIDFSDFPDKSCIEEEKQVRFILGSLGLKTENLDTQPKKERDRYGVKQAITQ